MKLILIILSIILILGSSILEVNAELVFEKGNNVDIKVPCFNNGELCSSSALCNLTTTYPNNSLVVDNQVMTNSISYFNYTISGSLVNENGDYQNTVFCEDGSNKDFTTFSFLITSTGTDLGTGESLLYFILTGGFLLLFFLFLYFAIATPYGNDIDEKGAVIKITKLKYWKLLFIAMTYLFFILFLNVLVGISVNFVSLTIFSGILGFLFTALMSLSYPLGIVILVISLWEIVRDANIQKNIDKFGSALR